MGWWSDRKYRRQSNKVNRLRDKASKLRGAAVRCETKANSECRKLHKMQAVR